MAEVNRTGWRRRTRTPRAVVEYERFVEIVAAGSMASLDESYLPKD